MSLREPEFESKWAGLGIAFIGDRDDHFVDPEQTIVDSLSMLYHQRKYLRLFLDWLTEYHDLVHVERLLSIAKKLPTHSALELQMLGSIANYATTVKKDLRWRIIETYCSHQELTPFRSDDDIYLLSKHGASTYFAKYKIAIPDLAKAARFIQYKKLTPRRTMIVYNQWMYLRDLFGVNWRADTAVQIIKNTKNPLVAKKILHCSYETVHRNWNELKECLLFNEIKPIITSHIHPVKH